jgi:hypothetical protein
MQTYMLKENVEARCERKVLKVHQKLLTSKDPSGVKRKDFRGRKPGFIGGLFKKDESKKEMKKTEIEKRIKKQKQDKKEALDKLKKELNMKAGGRAMRAGGGLMEATQRLRRQGLKIGGKGCKLAMKGRGRAYGKNS